MASQGYRSGVAMAVAAGVFEAGGVAISLAATGPGRFSLDRAAGWDDNLSGVWWGVAVLGAALVVSLVTLTVGRTRPVAEQATVAG